MTAPWVTMQDVISVRTATSCEAARELVREKHPNQPGTEQEKLLEFVRPDYTPVREWPSVIVAPSQDPYRGNFIAVAYMLGASAGQLSKLLGIKRSTVFELVRRRLPDTEQRNLWRRNNKLTYEGIEVIRNMYYSLLRTDTDAAKKHTMEVVMLLEQELEFDVDHLR